MAQFARFSAVTAHLRELQREGLAALQEADHASPEQREFLLQRAEGLEIQSDRVLAHAATLSIALRFLVGGVLLMVLCSLVIGASVVIDALGVVALVLFVLGVVSTMVGLYLVLSELRVSLEARIRAWQHQTPAAREGIVAVRRITPDFDDRFG